MILLILMTNLNFQDSSFFQYIQENVPLGRYVFRGHYNDFTRKWHLKVGVTIIILMIVTVFWPQISDLLFWVPWHYCRRACCTGSIVLQSDLNKYYEGYEFTLWDRYAYILTVIYFVITFSPGLPLLMPLGLLFCLVIYWIDKLMGKLECDQVVLRHYKKPPAFTAKINTKAFDILPYCVLLHSILAIFVYTSPEIYPQSVDETSRYISGKVTTVYNGQYTGFAKRVTPTLHH
jgi:hypothetical protein